MPFASLQAFIDAAIFAARVPGEMPLDDDPVIGADFEAAVWAAEVLHEIADEAVKDPETRGLITKNFSLPVGGDGTAPIPPGMLAEHIDAGSVIDANGNVLVRVHHFDDYKRWLPDVYGYYCIENGKFYTKEIGTGSETGTDGPLSIMAPFEPTAATLPDILMATAITRLAARIRFGVLAPVRVPMIFPMEQ
jgi:hypothetical protein